MASNWVPLVSKNHELRRTVVQLEDEVSQMKQQHGEAKKTSDKTSEKMN